MTPKAIHYSIHARLRLRQRQITRQEVRWLLARGMREPQPTYGGQQRWGCRGYLRHDEAKVIFVEDALSVTVLTVEWLD